MRFKMNFGTVGRGLGLASKLQHSLAINPVHARQVIRGEALNLGIGRRVKLAPASCWPEEQFGALLRPVIKIAGLRYCTSTAFAVTE